MRRSAIAELDSVENRTKGPRQVGPGAHLGWASADGHLEELCRLRELAKASKQYTAAIQAEIKRGEAAGFYVKRRENLKPQMSREQLVASVCALLRISPEQLRAMQASGPTLRVVSEASSKP